MKEMNVHHCKHESTNFPTKSEDSKGGVGQIKSRDQVKRYTYAVSTYEICRFKILHRWVDRDPDSVTYDGDHHYQNVKEKKRGKKNKWNILIPKNNI